MSDAYTAYIAAKDAYDESVGKVEAAINRLRSFAIPLMSKWRECYIELMGVGNPMDMISYREKVDGSNVPTPQEIHALLVRHSDSLNAAKRAYDALSPQEKKELVLPPWARRQR